MKAFYKSFRKKLRLNSEKVQFITKRLVDSENISDSNVLKSSFMRTFRHGIQKGFAEMMMSTDFSLEGTGKRLGIIFSFCRKIFKASRDSGHVHG